MGRTCLNLTVSSVQRENRWAETELFCMFLSSALELGELLNLEVKSILGNFG